MTSENNSNAKSLRNREEPGPKIDIPASMSLDASLQFTPLFGIDADTSFNSVRTPTHGIPFVQPSSEFSLHQPPTGRKPSPSSNIEPTEQSHPKTSHGNHVRDEEAALGWEQTARLAFPAQPVSVPPIVQIKAHHDSANQAAEQIAELVEGMIPAHERIESSASVMSQGKNHAAELMLHLASSRMNIGSNELTANNSELSPTERAPATLPTTLPATQQYWPYPYPPPQPHAFFNYQQSRTEEAPWSYPHSPFAGPSTSTGYWTIPTPNWAGPSPTTTPSAVSFPFPAEPVPVAEIPVVAKEEIEPVEEQPVKKEPRPRKEPAKRRLSIKSSDSDDDYEKSKFKKSRQRPASSFLSGGGPSGLACQMCGKTFTRRFNLRAHERSHLDIKPFQCTMCSQSFCRRHDLKRHERLHTGAVPYSCELCGKGFNRVESHARHKKAANCTGNSPGHIASSPESDD